MDKKLPYYYHPTMPVFVDDDRQFLDMITMGLSDHYVCKTFDEPQKALHFLNHYQPPPLILNSIDHIREQAYDASRFETIAVLVVDYTMPLNGLTICEHLKETPLKKILLTGDADEKIALAAFNRGLIHRFVRKDDPMIISVLLQNIAELQYEYFLEQSEIVAHKMQSNPNLWKNSCLRDHVFSDIFFPFYEQQQPTEYYLTSTSGDFLFLNREGKETQLSVVDENLMKIFEKLANEHPEAPYDIANGIRKRQQLLADHHKALEINPSQWSKFAYAAKSKESDGNTYYYSYITQPHFNLLDADKIISYKTYMAESETSAQDKN